MQDGTENPRRRNHGNLQGRRMAMSQRLSIDKSDGNK